MTTHAWLDEDIQEQERKIIFMILLLPNNEVSRAEQCPENFSKGPIIYQGNLGGWVGGTSDSIARDTQPSALEKLIGCYTILLHGTVKTMITSC